MKTLGKMALLVALTIGGLAVPTAATAANADGFNQQATKIAKVGKCQSPRKKSGPGSFTYSSLVCDLRGERLNIISFKNKPQESRWLRLTCAGLPEQWVMIGFGFVITAYDGNERAARVGSRVYGGDTYLCSDLNKR